MVPLRGLKNVASITFFPLRKPFRGFINFIISGIETGAPVLKSFTVSGSPFIQFSYNQDNRAQGSENQPVL
jgi:hypothetical protein